MKPSGGARPGNSDLRPGADATDDELRGPKRWSLGVSLLRGILFFLAMSFTFTALLYLNVEKGNTGLIIYIFCMVGTVVAAALRLFRSTAFESILLVLANLIFLSTAFFEYKEKIMYMKFPEKISDSVVVANIRSTDSMRVVRFKDARVVSAEIAVMEDSMNLGTMGVLAPIVDTWRDSTKGDSVFGFVVGYSFDTYNESIISEWEDTCRFGVVYQGSEYTAQYAYLLDKWKVQTGRVCPTDPVFIEKGCYYYLKRGDEVAELIGVFVFLLVGWIIIVSIVRGISAAIRGAGTT